MPSIQFNGVVSNLDTKSIIDSLMQAEKAPLTRLQARESDLTSQRSAYAQLSTSLADLISKVQAFTDSKAGAAVAASVADSSLFGASASAGAVAGQYRVTVDHLATATRATSVAGLGAAVTDPDQALASLNLPGAVTAGQFSVIVDGQVRHVTVGNPATTTLRDVMDGIASAIQDQLTAGAPGVAADPDATVTASVQGNRLQLSVAGGAGTHSIRFGTAGDTSNALGVLGLANQVVSNAQNPTITGATALGVVRTSAALNAAGLSGLASTTTGKLTVNGVDIAYNTTTDSLSTVIGRINASAAGVIASLDRTNDRIVLTRKDAGALAIDIHDTSGSLGAALGLAPDTITAQVIGEAAQVTVDGRSVTSDTNHVTNAIDGVTLDLTSLSAPNTSTTLTVGVDRSAVTGAINAFIKSFNALGDQLDKLTVNTPGQNGQAGTEGPLAGDWSVQSMFLDLRSTILQAVKGLTGSFTSLGDIGINTGPIGAGTDRLALDETKLNAAFDQDPARVAALLDDATGAMKPLLDRLNATNGPKGTIQANEQGIDSEVRTLHQQEADAQARIDAAQAAYEAKFAALESLLATLQSQSSALSAQVTSMNGSSSK